MNNLKDFFILESITIKESMKALERVTEKCLLVINDKNQLLGTLTDGDIRRSILSGMSYNTSIAEFYCKNPIYLSEENNNNEGSTLLKENKINFIPIVDKNKIIIDYISWDKLNIVNKSISLNYVKVIIMAGGKGTRLKPFTNILPKPLIPIHEKPLIEHIINNFKKFNCKDFILSVNYKSKILKAYFEEYKADNNISYIDEKIPLGTAGSIKLAQSEINSDFFVTNCDIIVKADYSKIFDFHKKNNFDVTLVASAKEFEVPYGVCRLNTNGHLDKIDEKPKFDYLINTGLYVLSPSVFDFIPDGEFYHMTNLIEDIKQKNGNIGVYPINEEDWIDVGQWTEYKKAVDIL